MPGLEADAAVVGTAGKRPRPGEPGDQPDAPARRTRLPGWAVLAVPALAELAVGGYQIAGPSLWRDEAATISGSQRPVGAIFALMRNQDAVHGPYYLLMHAAIAVGGTSETTLRVPSLIAMCLAAGLLAALGRRLARASDLPFPQVTGLAAGLTLVAVPLTTRYAQEARPYALTTVFAVLATYLLVRAAEPGARRWWWAVYGAALAVTGAFNLFAVLLAVAHGVSLAVAGRTDAVRRWIVACAGAAVLLMPLAVMTAEQSGQLGWVTTPDASTVASLLRDFSGASLAIPVAIGLGWLGCAAGRGLRRGAGLTLAIVALPWLVIPPVVLLAASFARPVFVERYVVFCLPALSLLVAAGLAWLPRLARQAKARSGRPDCRHAPVLAWLPSAALALLLAAAVAGPQIAIRRASARADDLRAVAAVLAAHERAGDAVVYLPWDVAVIRMAYPAPFDRLRDVELAASPVASATLRGLPAAASVVSARLARYPAGVARVWAVQWAPPGTESLGPAGGAARRVLSGMRLVRRWRIESVVLSLYARR